MATRERRGRSHEQLRSSSYEIEISVEEGSFAIVVALIASIFVAAISYSLHCSTAYDCTNKLTCTPIYEDYCSFRNSVTPAGFRIFNLSNEGEAMGSLSRGICSPGERQNVNTLGELICVRAPSFPNAYLKEIATPYYASPTTMSDSQRVCGKWISARPNVFETQYWSFFDEDVVRKDVTEDIQNDGSATVAFDDVSRFRAECERMVVNGAFSASASTAYDYLKAKMRFPSKKNDLLNHIGILTSHYCDGPVAIGITFGSNNRFIINASSGANLEADAASEALYAIGEGNVARRRAREFIVDLKNAPDDVLEPVSGTELGHILDGAIIGTWLESALQIQSPVTILMSNKISTLRRFLHALAMTSTEHAHAYLLACAAQCAFSTRAVVTGEFGASTATMSAASASMREQQRSKHRVLALGRLVVAKPAVDRFLPIGAEEVFAANSMTWSMLVADRTIPNDATPSNANDACFRASQVAFADALDAAVLKKLTTPRLLNMLGPVVKLLKKTVALAIQSGKVAELIDSPANRDRIASEARAVKFRIAGAPRGSEFGRDEAFVRPLFNSADGALLMMLKQANAIFLDRIRMVLDNVDLCEHPPLYPSTSRNAYLLTAAPCAMLLPNILVPPFASDRYDETSLYSRIGFVIAHEIAHVASKTYMWNRNAATELLQNYSRTTWVEAAADLTAAVAIVATGKVTTSQLCDQVAQLWCARVTGGEGRGVSHPSPNFRGNEICSFLRAL